MKLYSAPYDLRMISVPAPCYLRIFSVYAPYLFHTIEYGVTTERVRCRYGSGRADVRD
ncbi:MAG: hypothetical protein KH897_06315 [Bacteroides sp.]|uniref:hypothetical protein n=1 Tax=Bacteroides sp. TaxID=29523 RepID=UPI0025C58A61|nr:hypothetical protein [Bacteroides sp.]MBS6237989.1 hypothetical protein [Bacteroides sp.]